MCSACLGGTERGAMGCSKGAMLHGPSNSEPHQVAQPLSLHGYQVGSGCGPMSSHSFHDLRRAQRRMNGHFLRLRWRLQGLPEATIGCPL